MRRRADSAKQKVFKYHIVGGDLTEIFENLDFLYYFLSFYEDNQCGR